MVATTEQKARLLDLVTNVLELTRDGKRDATEVASVLQIIKDDRGFAERLLGLTATPTVSFKRDMHKERWTLLEDVQDPDPETAFVNGLESVPFLENGERRINGEELVLRARGKLRANYGQRHAEYFLEHQEKIPHELRKYYLVFTGTVWRDRLGRRYVPYLYCDGERWGLHFSWLVSVFGSNDRLPRPRE